MSQMAYTKIREDTFETLAMNAGVLLADFDPATGTVTNSNIIGSTTGGINFKATPTFKDFGEDIDNCPKNTKELKMLDDWEITLSGTFITADTESARRLIALADIDGTDTSKVIPRSVLKGTDFEDIWLVVDYGNVNTGDNPGHCVVHMMDALSTGGFQIQTTDKEKGKFAFEFTAHYSLDAQDTVPFEVYIKKGAALAPLTVTSIAGTNVGDSKITVSGYTLGSGESYKYKTDASTAPTVTYGQTISDWTALTSSSDITPTSGHTKIAVVVVDSNNKAIGYGNTTLTVKAS